MTIDHVESLEVVLSDSSVATLGPVDTEQMLRRSAADTLEARIHARLPGFVEEHRTAIAEGFPPYWRRAGGYRLGPSRRRALQPGTAGGRVRGVTRGRHRGDRASGSRCPSEGDCVGHFASVADAIAATEDALSTRPSAVELIDRTILELSRQKLEYSALGSILVGDPGALPLRDFDGGDAAEASAGVERIAALWQRNGHGYHTLRATNPQQAALLKVRSAGLGLLMAASEGTRRPVAFIEDTAVDPAR